MDSGTSKFEVAGTYKGWTILLAPAPGKFDGIAHCRARIQAAGGEPIDVSTDSACCQMPSQARSRAIAHARSFIDALGVHGDGSLSIGFPAKSDYRHPVGVYFPVVVDGEEHRALITRECLGDNFGDPADGKWTRLFEIHRAQIQLVAERLIRAGTRSNVLINRSAWPA